MLISLRKFELFCPLGAIKLGVQQKKVTASDSAKPGVALYLQGPWLLLAQIRYGAFFIWGNIDAIKFLWKSGEGVGG